MPILPQITLQPDADRTALRVDTSWICRISIYGVYFDTKPGTQHQAEVAKSLARTLNGELNVSVINLINEE